MIVHFCMFFAPFFSENLWDLLSEARSYSCKDISVLQFLKYSSTCGRVGGQRVKILPI